MTACANETHRKKCVRAQGRLSPPFLFVKPKPSSAKEFTSVMAFEGVYNCEILISEIERRPALYDCLLKKYSDKGLKERLWGKACEAVVCF